MDGRAIRTRRIRLPVLVGAISILTLAALGIPGPAAAGEGINTGYFGDVAIKGYDPVAYFTDGQAIKGSEQHAYHWLGATWHFANAEHQEMFASQPVKYAPQYGGHCADGVAMGTITTNIDPTAFRIIDGKLYLNYDPGAAGGLEANPGKIASAENHWPEVKATLASQ